MINRVLRPGRCPGFKNKHGFVLTWTIYSGVGVFSMHKPKRVVGSNSASILMTLGKFLNIAKPYFFHQQIGDNTC
jgi:hypothetical protein